jgi:sec-independent protein translocase protein TatB
MFDIGWSEMAIIALVILVVLGPKELPHALKTISHWMRAARKLGAEFQSGVNEIVRDAELEDARKQLQGIGKHTIEKKIEKAIDPTGEIKKAMNDVATEAKVEAVEQGGTTPSVATMPDATPAAVQAETTVAVAGPTIERPPAPADVQPGVVERN